LRRAFQAGIDEVFAVTYPQNVASQAVCRRIGMTHLGSTDRYYDVTSELFRATRGSG
jgi:RimJ/RimL family protein N-acetyltransferase